MEEKNEIHKAQGHFQFEFNTKLKKNIYIKINFYIIEEEVMEIKMIFNFNGKSVGMSRDVHDLGVVSRTTLSTLYLVVRVYPRVS